MNTGVRTALRRGAAIADSLARRGGRRVVASRDLGLAYGEELLGRFTAYLGVDLVLDVGANRGQFAHRLRVGAGYAGRIVSFEPQSQAAAELSRHAERDPSWSVRRCALATEAGEAVMHIMSDDQFSSLLMPSDAFDGKFAGRLSVVASETVPTITLTEAVAQAPAFRSCLIKLDTQGTELQILGASPDVLGRFSAVLVEVGFTHLYKGEPGFEDVRLAMNQWGYTLCALYPNNQGHFPHLFQMDALFVRTALLPEAS